MFRHGIDYCSVFVNLNVLLKMAERVVVPQNHDPDIAALAVDTNCDKLVKSMDPVSCAKAGLPTSDIVTTSAGHPRRPRHDQVGEELGLS